MSLIIKDKLQMMIKGYPTISDKYNVAGATLEGNTPVKFGELVKFGSTNGYFEAGTSLSSIADAAGFVVATNVKVAEDFPGTTVQVNPGEAFNLLVNGAIAVELDAGATEAQIKPNSAVVVILATGKLTTSDNAASSTAVALPNVVFTGTYENQGTSAAPKFIAEILVK